MNGSNVPRKGKPLIVRVVGYLDLFFILWLPYACWGPHPHMEGTSPAAFVTLLALVAILPLSGVWLIATIAYRISQRHAMMTAGALMEAARRAREGQGPGGLK